MKKKILMLMAASMLATNIVACSAETEIPVVTSEDTTENNDSASDSGTEAASQEDKKDVESHEEKTTFENDEDGGHAIHADGEDISYENIEVKKTGESGSEEADFYGDNAAVFAENGATLNIKNAEITTDGGHANAVFSYGEGTTVNISDSTIRTNSNNSGGLMTTGGGTMNAENLDIITQGGSSAAIRSDRGGGTVNVTGGYYETNGSGSPAIYSTADITVKNAELVSNVAQGVVVEGKNSVVLDNVNLTANNTKKNSKKSDVYQAVMLYQSMSGDADEGTAIFKMNGGSLVNKNGGIFYVNNTTAEIDIEDVDFTYASDDFLRIEAAGWGSEGSNGGQVTFTATKQAFEGNTVVDNISTLNMYLNDGTVYSGAINTDGAAGAVYVEISEDSTWKLTGDSYITSLTCDEDAIDLNGFTLYVNGTAYEEGTSSTGEAVDAYKGSTSDKNTKSDKGKNDSKPDSDHAKPGNGEKPSGKPDKKPESSENGKKSSKNSDEKSNDSSSKKMSADKKE
ncbi:hypothetical protein [Oribacterium sp. WCC10]|uniref:hypothetical protein n=1 Tax=Oribacterium sp. WCC10 TaxID=1855343 RepID=UPI0008E8014D|nr:hypothetical protein [Oribacterium sp. WCC10]SFG62370.1 hypothetical protein SAMN05216356_11545 [Oribacterium sp. WCC10]